MGRPTVEQVSWRRGKEGGGRGGRRGKEGGGRREGREERIGGRREGAKIEEGRDEGEEQTI